MSGVALQRPNLRECWMFIEWIKIIGRLGQTEGNLTFDKKMSMKRIIFETSNWIWYSQTSNYSKNVPIRLNLWIWNWSKVNHFISVQFHKFQQSTGPIADGWWKIKTELNYGVWKIYIPIHLCWLYFFRLLFHNFWFQIKFIWLWLKRAVRRMD